MPYDAGSEMCVIQSGKPFSPSTSWAQGDPIIDRAKIDLVHDFVRWMARHSQREDYSRPDMSPLVAAMRFYLMWEYDDEVLIETTVAPGIAQLDGKATTSFPTVFTCNGRLI